MAMRPPDLTHQLIYKNPHAYCAWPDIKILQDGDWVLAFCETMRRPGITHLDPSLLNMLLRSTDGGESWDGPQVIAGYDFSGMDDPGMVQLSSGVLLVNTARNSFVSLDTADGDAAYARFNRRAGFAWAGSYPLAEGTYVHRSEDGGRTWSGSARVDVAPFASGYTLRPITELEDGSLLLPCYDESQVPCPSFVVPSYDQGRTWTGACLIAVDDRMGFFEPALLALPGGRVLALLRTHEKGNHHLYQCHSDDGGRTWSSAQPTPMRGLPPHMLRLQDGRLLCVYGCRWAPFGIRACLSNDDGASWDIDNELILRDDFPNGDLGYPTSVQRADGSICTAYYGQGGEGVTCIQASSYRIPD